MMKRIRFSCIALLCFAMLAVGCRQEQITPMLEPHPPRPIAPGASVLVEFPADNLWHASGFVARSGDIIVFEPVGEAAEVENTALLVHIGRSMTQVIKPGMRQKVTRLGEIHFRADTHRLGPISGKTLQVRVLNEQP